MPKFTGRNARAEVLTFKEGLLSPIAHDLRIRVQRFEIVVENGSIEAEFDLSSLIVVCARKDGTDEPGTLSDADKAKIQKTIQLDVLHTDRHPWANFEADFDDLQGGLLEGQLELHGETRQVQATLGEEGDHLRVEVNVNQPDFGIKPYSAMMGTLKVRPDVIIAVDLLDTRLDDLL